MLKKYAAVFMALLLANSVWAVTQQDVDFAQRKCSMRNDPQECATYRSIANAYQREQRDRLEHDAAIKSGQPMQGSVNIDTNIQTAPNGDYRWNAKRGKYCWHNRSGSVNRCVN